MSSDLASDFIAVVVDWAFWVELFDDLCFLAGCMAGTGKRARVSAAGKPVERIASA